MRRQYLEQHFRKVYPECSGREVRDLVEAIVEDKYWSVLPSKKDAFYVVALTRAKVRLEQGSQAKATHVGRIRVVGRASPFCRRGRVLMALKEGSSYEAKSVVTWPAFLKLMNADARSVYALLRNGSLPPFIGVKELAALRAQLHKRVQEDFVKGLKTREL